MKKSNILCVVALAVSVYFLSFASLAYSGGLDTTISYLEQQRNKSKVEMCKANLIQINGAKQVWALDKNKSNDSTPIWSDLVPEYFTRQPTCSSGGTYTIGRVNEPPTCSIKEHNPDPSKFK